MNTIIRKNSFGDLFDELFASVPNNLAKSNNVPLVNISEDDNGYYISLVAPGIKKEDFKINLEKGLLTISYDKQVIEEKTSKKFHRQEFNLSGFKRSFHIEDNVDSENIEAAYNEGILNLNLPKKQELKIEPKAILIK